MATNILTFFVACLIVGAVLNHYINPLPGYPLWKAIGKCGLVIGVITAPVALIEGILEGLIKHIRSKS